ncbi:MAG: hypothetical protein ACM3O6_17630 [Acidobacteriota bacterium]
MPRRSVAIRVLDPKEIAAAYPLACLLAPSLDMPTWQRFAGAILAGNPTEERRILAAVGEGGYLCGLLIYRVEHDLRHGRVLTAEHVIALDIVDRKPVAAALLAALEDLSEALGCDALYTSFDTPQESLRAVWEGAGHQIARTLLCKTINEGERRS